MARYRVELLDGAGELLATNEGQSHFVGELAVSWDPMLPVRTVRVTRLGGDKSDTDSETFSFNVTLD